MTPSQSPAANSTPVYALQRLERPHLVVDDPTNRTLSVEAHTFPQTAVHPRTMPFAQLVIGPPGAGKSTYCNGMQQFMGAIGRKASIVNLDPANDPISSNYSPALDIRDLISLEKIMQDEEIGLGPNGGVLFALEELESDLLGEEGGWFEQGLKSLGEDYVLFDCPGQVELFTHHGSLRRVLGRLEKMGYRVCLPSIYFLKNVMR